VRVRVTGNRRGEMEEHVKSGVGWRSRGTYNDNRARTER
jgi:hypothetical protein